MSNRKCAICNKYSATFYTNTNSYDILKCHYCKAGFLSRMPTKKVLHDFYSNFTYDTGFINEKLIRKEATNVLKNLKKYKGKLLDIGSGAGFFIHEAQKMGWSCLGIETSKKLVDYGKVYLNINIIHGDFLNINLKNEKYDVIILSQIIEHITEPYKMLNKVYSYLSKGGILYIATPNFNSHLSKVLKVNFPYLSPPEHVIFYSPKTLYFLLQKTGFQRMKIRTYGYPQDLSGIIKKLIKKPDSNSLLFNINFKSNDRINKYRRLFKYMIFDKFFCVLFYRVLNLYLKGSMIEVYAQKTILINE